MNIKEYIKSNIIYIFLTIITYICISLLLILFNTNKILIILIILLLCILSITIFILDYYKRYKFYLRFKNTLNKLDKKYLITSMINSSNFIDGNIILEYLYEINKSFHEEVNDYKYITKEFIEYIDLWCHEIKTPISTSKLLIENNKSKITNSILEEIDKIENYVEQVLYYSRSETVEKDYIVKDINLYEIINDVIKRNKKDLINKKIKVNVDVKDNVKSDSKWISFIVNQIIVNSIKYSKDNNSYINIYSKKNKNNVLLYIEDNGIGIKEEEISKVFDKGFTGSNGREKYNSTGIGLYLCKKLCNRLGHNIEVTSIYNENTIVTITFPTSSMHNNE